MIQLDFDVSDIHRQFKEALKPLTQVEQDRIISRSINKTLQITRTKLKREVTKIYNLSTLDAKSQFPIDSARSGSLTGIIKAKTSRINFDKFNPTIRQTVGGDKRKTSLGRKKTTFGPSRHSDSNQGVTISIFKGNSYKLPSAFLLHTKKWAGKIAIRGQYNSVFDLKRRRRRIQSGMDFPLAMMKSLSVHSTATNKQVMLTISPLVMETYLRIFKEQLNGGFKYTGKF